MLYQNVSVGLLAGMVKVWAAELSPLVGVVAPSCAPKLPL